MRPPLLVTATTVAMLLCGAGCATAPTVRVDQGQVQPALQPLETRVLEDSRKFQQLLERNGALYHDPALAAYLDGLMQPLTPTVPPTSGYHFRLQIVRDPTLNAYTLCDGTTYFNSGLVARLKTAQQFAFVAGHEIAHIMNRDLVYFTDSLHRKTIAYKLAGLVLTPALASFGFGGVGDMGASLIYAASVTGFGRGREARADRESVELMRRLGYDERETVRVLELFIAEHDRYQRGIEVGFFSSHPSNKQRLKVIRELMGPKALDVFAPEGVDGAFLDATQRLRIDNAASNIQLERYYHAAEDLQIILRRAPDDAAAHHHLAEAYRKIAEDPTCLKRELSRKAWKALRHIADESQRAYWQGRALEEYRAAMALNPQLPDPHRGLGLLRERQGYPGEALEHFQQYLALRPDAPDRRFVLAAIRRVQPRGIVEAR